MERRSSHRIIVMLEAEIISGNKAYSGFWEMSTEFPGVSFYTYVGLIENLSADGMLITIHDKTILDLSPGSSLEVGFQLPSGEILNLHCMVRRHQNITSSHGSKQSIGMVIIDPPPVYGKFIKDGLNQIR